MNKEIGEVWNRPQTNGPAETETATKEVTSPTALSCPRCMDHQLEEVSNKEAFYKQCSFCKGIWFNINELTKALGNNVKFTAPEEKSPKGLKTSSLRPFCPICDVHLIHLNALEMPEITVEACVICQGRWVDGHEIAQFQNRGLFTQIKNFVMSLF